MIFDFKGVHNLSTLIFLQTPKCRKLQLGKQGKVAPLFKNLLGNTLRP